MDIWFSTGVVTPLIQFCRVILSRMVKPYCSQSSVTFSGLSSIDLLRSFLDNYSYLASLFVPLCFPQYFAVNTIRFMSCFPEDC